MKHLIIFIFTNNYFFSFEELLKIKLFNENYFNNKPYNK